MKSPSKLKVPYFPKKITMHPICEVIGLSNSSILQVKISRVSILGRLRDYSFPVSSLRFFFEADPDEQLFLAFTFTPHNI